MCWLGSSSNQPRITDSVRRSISKNVWNRLNKRLSREIVHEIVLFRFRREREATFCFGRLFVFNRKMKRAVVRWHVPFVSALDRFFFLSPKPSVRAASVFFFLSLCIGRINEITSSLSSREYPRRRDGPCGVTSHLRSNYLARSVRTVAVFVSGTVESLGRAESGKANGESGERTTGRRINTFFFVYSDFT